MSTETKTAATTAANEIASIGMATVMEWKAEDGRHRYYLNDSKGRAFGYIDAVTCTYHHATGSKFLRSVRCVFAKHGIAVA